MSGRVVLRTLRPAGRRVLTGADDSGPRSPGQARDPFLSLFLTEACWCIRVDLLRVQGDSLRRMTETETAWWKAEMHAGPVIFQEGDYYGQTVNIASRIADHARPGEVLVSQAVVEESSGADLAFREIGPVELKGVTGAMRLHASGPG
jgi:hypothetical protein